MENGPHPVSFCSVFMDPLSERKLLLPEAGPVLEVLNNFSVVSYEVADERDSATHPHKVTRTLG